jgi:predicted lipase
MVHSGFYVAYKGVSSLVRTEVDRLLGLYKTAKLVITGHSLGGAMAVLCALEMKEVHGKVDYVYTYGQPRVGNSNFASFYQVRIP